MIRSIHLQNYEGHKDTTVEFDDHFNILSGKSASGKSSINRAVLWVVSNSSGSSYISWWSLGKPDKNGKRSQKDGEMTSVTLYLDNGHKIKRERTSKTNIYQIDDELPFEAVGGGAVPEKVSALLNFSDVNLQVQFGAQFLVSQSSGEVAKYLNKIVNLEEADIYQTAVEAKRRKCSTDLDAARKTAFSTKEELKNFDWVDTSSKLVSKLEKLEASSNQAMQVVESMERSIAKYDTEQGRLETCECIPRADQLFVEITSLLAEKTRLTSLITRMEASLIRHSSYLSDMKFSDVIEKGEKLIKKIMRLDISQSTDRANLATMINSTRKHVSLISDLGQVKQELDLAEREFSLVNICPYCGSKIGHVDVAF